MFLLSISLFAETSILAWSWIYFWHFGMFGPLCSFNFNATQKTLRRGSNGSDNLAEAVAKLCEELDHVTKDGEATLCFSVQLNLDKLFGWLLNGALNDQHNWTTYQSLIAFGNGIWLLFYDFTEFHLHVQESVSQTGLQVPSPVWCSQPIWWNADIVWLNVVWSFQASMRELRAEVEETLRKLERNTFRGKVWLAFGYKISLAVNLRFWHNMCCIRCFRGNINKDFQKKIGHAVTNNLQLLGCYKVSWMDETEELCVTSRISKTWRISWRKRRLKFRTSDGFCMLL